MNTKNKKWSFNKSSDKPQGSKNLRTVLVAVIALALVVSIISAVYMLSFSSISDDTKSCVLYKGNNLYFSGNGQLLDITDSDNPQPVTTDTELDYVPLNIYKSCYDTDYIYSVLSNQSDLYKFEINSSEFTREVWVDAKSLSLAFSALNGTSKFSTSKMYELCVCDDYVLFYYFYDAISESSDTDNMFRVGAISKDGKDMRLLDSSIRASSMVSDGDYVYYYDNAYKSNGSRGIYKMKADGSDKELLLGGFSVGVDDSAAFLCNNLRVFDNYLYFIDDSADGKSRVCRIDLDSLDKEYVTQKGAYRFTVSDNTLYYSVGEDQKTSGEARDVFSVQIDTKKETALFKVHGVREFSVYKNHLYMYDHQNFNTDTNGKNTIGGRYDLNNKTLQTLFCDVEKPGFTYNSEEDIYEMTNNSSRKYYWEESDFGTDSAF